VSRRRGASDSRHRGSSGSRHGVGPPRQDDDADAARPRRGRLGSDGSVPAAPVPAAPGSRVRFQRLRFQRLGSSGRHPVPGSAVTATPCDQRTPAPSRLSGSSAIRLGQRVGLGQRGPGLVAEAPSDRGRATRAARAASGPQRSGGGSGPSGWSSGSDVPTRTTPARANRPGHGNGGIDGGRVQSLPVLSCPVSLTTLRQDDGDWNAPIRSCAPSWVHATHEADGAAGDRTHLPQCPPFVPAQVVNVMFPEDGCP
jgi:hypothetical protein